MKTYIQIIALDSDVKNIDSAISAVGLGSNNFGEILSRDGIDYRMSQGCFQTGGNDGHEKIIAALALFPSVKIIAIDDPSTIGRHNDPLTLTLTRERLQKAESRIVTQR